MDLVIERPLVVALFAKLAGYTHCRGCPAASTRFHAAWCNLERPYVLLVADRCVNGHEEAVFKNDIRSMFRSPLLLYSIRSGKLLQLGSPWLEATRDFAACIRKDKPVKLYVFGGLTYRYIHGTDELEGVLHDCVHEFDFSKFTNGWMCQPTMPTARANSVAVELNGYVYVLGGYAEGDHIPLRAAEIFNPETGEWWRLPPMLKARAEAAAVAVKETVCVVGGNGLLRDNLYDTVEIYNAENSSWAFLQCEIYPRWQPALVHVGAGAIYCFGGSSVPLKAGQSVCIDIDDCKLHELPIAPFQMVRSSAVSVEGSIYVFGRGKTPAVCKFDPQTFSWSQLLPMSVAVERCCAAHGLLLPASVARLFEDCTAPQAWIRPGGADITQLELEAKQAFNEEEVQREIDMVLEGSTIESGRVIRELAVPIDSGSSTFTQNVGVGSEGDLQQSEVRDASKEEETYSQVVEESIQMALQEEQAFLVDAVMRSKADAPLTSDGVVLMRLKRIGKLDDLLAALLSSSHLAGPISRVIAAGCEVKPAWTPAILLVPLTQEQVEELGMELSAHHIIAHSSDKELVMAALKDMPSKKRPSVAVPTVAVGPLSAEEAHNSMSDMPAPEVECTFLQYKIPKDVSEVLGFAHTAPCGHADSHQPGNPRRWKKPV